MKEISLNDACERVGAAIFGEEWIGRFNET